LIVLLPASYLAQSQTNVQEPIGEVIHAIISEIQPTIPIADSLTVIHGIVFHRHWPITKKEKRDILRSLRRQKCCIPFDKSYFPGWTFVSAIKIFPPNGVPDTTLMNYISSIKPFYLISAPLYFNQRQNAIIDVDMIGYYGVTYLLEKRGNEWFIKQDIPRWYVLHNKPAPMDVVYFSRNTRHINIKEMER
jgi:hypothetical protein